MNRTFLHQLKLCCALKNPAMQDLPYSKHSIRGAVPRWLLLTTPIATNAYVMEPKKSAEMKVPGTAKTEMVPKLRKKSRFFRVKPAAKTIGGSRP